MSEEKLLDMWQSITGYVEDWETKFSEILDELENLSIVMGNEEKEEEYEDFEEEGISIDALIEDVKMTRSNFRETIKQALNGEISIVDVEEVFRATGEFLRGVEEKIMKLREAEEYEELEDEENYNEEDYY